MLKKQQEQRSSLQTCFLESLVLKERTKKPHRVQVTTSLTLRGEKLNFKVVAMEEFQTSYNGFSTSSVTTFGHVRSINGSIKFINHNHIW